MGCINDFLRELAKAMTESFCIALANPFLIGNNRSQNTKQKNKVVYFFFLCQQTSEKEQSANFKTGNQNSQTA